MGAPEVMLRLGCSLVAWLVLFAHCLWLVALHATGCGDGGSAPWLVLFGWTPIVFAFVLLLQVGSTVPGVGRALRLPGVLFAPLLVFAARGLVETFVSVNLGSGSICGSGSSWTLMWAPVQFATLVAIGVGVVTVWRRAAA